MFVAFLRRDDGTDWDAAATSVLLMRWRKPQQYQHLARRLNCSLSSCCELSFYSYDRQRVKPILKTRCVGPLYFTAKSRLSAGVAPFAALGPARLFRLEWKQFFFTIKQVFSILLLKGLQSDLWSLVQKTPKTRDNQLKKGCFWSQPKETVFSQLHFFFFLF